MKYSKEIKECIIQDYKKGMSWDSLCKKYTTNTSTLHKIFNDGKVVRNREALRSWSKEKQELLKELYLKNCFYSEMKEKLNCSAGALDYWVTKLSLPKRGKGRNNDYPNPFSKRGVESDYWLGYIFADGNVYKGKRNYQITLISEKEYVLTKYKEWFNNIPKISKKPYFLKNGTLKYMYCAFICSKYIVEWFENTLGICGKKHHTLNPNITLSWDMIRGYFDGDGCASKGQFQLKSCSKVWLERIQTFFKGYGIESTLSLSYKDCWGLSVYRKAELKKLVPLLYQNKYYCHEYKYKLLEPYTGNNISKPSELLEG